MRGFGERHLFGERVRIRIPYDREYPYGREILGFVQKDVRHTGVVVISGCRRFVVPRERVTREIAA